MPPFVLAITGASGAVYAVRLLELLLREDRETHLIISAAGASVIQQELGVRVDPHNVDVSALLPNMDHVSRSVCHAPDDFFTPVASGSFLTGGMVVCPCSGGTLSNIVTGAGGNLITRAAEVHLKERRKLILTPRETPLSLSHIENLRSAHQAGAVVLPASPGWYHGVNNINDLVDFVVARILDQLEVKHDLFKRWGENQTKH